jgi:hypothetical protein
MSKNPYFTGANLGKIGASIALLIGMAFGTNYVTKKLGYAPPAPVPAGKTAGASTHKTSAKNASPKTNAPAAAPTAGTNAFHKLTEAEWKAVNSAMKYTADAGLALCGRVQKTEGVLAGFEDRLSADERILREQRLAQARLSDRTDTIEGRVDTDENEMNGNLRVLGGRVGKVEGKMGGLGEKIAKAQKTGNDAYVAAVRAQSAADIAQQNSTNALEAAYGAHIDSEVAYGTSTNALAIAKEAQETANEALARAEYAKTHPRGCEAGLERGIVYVGGAPVRGIKSLFGTSSKTPQGTNPPVYSPKGATSVSQP